ncbi:MAG: hypothetical protein QOD41_1658 [Cryptosporangiaceae bacterium]|nr:hypothetical protein [Cryptosporangiaceae bacterium]
MMVISRFTVPEDGAEAFLDRARPALAAFAACQGYLRGTIGRAADDPALWAIVTEWAGVGVFRRSLSSFDVKVHAAPLLAESINEPAAYEVIAVSGTGSAARAWGRAADAGQTRIGEAATPYAPRSLDPAAYDG